MIRQTPVKKITVSSVVGSAAYQAGMDDFRDGIVRFDDFVGKDAWHYERGRLFAAYCARLNQTPAPRRIGRRVSRAAIYELAGALKAGDVR